MYSLGKYSINTYLKLISNNKNIIPNYLLFYKIKNTVNGQKSPNIYDFRCFLEYLE